MQRGSILRAWPTCDRSHDCPRHTLTWEGQFTIEVATGFLKTAQCCCRSRRRRSSSRPSPASASAATASCWYVLTELQPMCFAVTANRLLAKGRPPFGLTCLLRASAPSVRLRKCSLYTHHVDNTGSSCIWIGSSCMRCMHLVKEPVISWEAVSFSTVILDNRRRVD